MLLTKLSLMKYTADIILLNSIVLTNILTYLYNNLTGSV